MAEPRGSSRRSSRTLRQRGFSGNTWPAPSSVEPTWATELVSFRKSVRAWYERKAFLYNASRLLIMTLKQNNASENNCAPLGAHIVSQQ